MATKRAFDVIIVGGGIAGSCLAGVLARGGLGVLVVEKESRFRDRVRGEGTWPWGVAHALKAGLGELFAQADVCRFVVSSALTSASRPRPTTGLPSRWMVSPRSRSPTPGSRSPRSPGQ